MPGECSCGVVGKLSPPSLAGRGGLWFGCEGGDAALRAAEWMHACSSCPSLEIPPRPFRNWCSIGNGCYSSLGKGSGCPGSQVRRVKLLPPSEMFAALAQCSPLEGLSQHVCHLGGVPWFLCEACRTASIRLVCGVGETSRSSLDKLPAPTASSRTGHDVWASSRIQEKLVLCES